MNDTTKQIAIYGGVGVGLVGLGIGGWAIYNGVILSGANSVFDVRIGERRLLNSMLSYQGGIGNPSLAPPPARIWLERIAAAGGHHRPQGVREWEPLDANGRPPPDTHEVPIVRTQLMRMGPNVPRPFGGSGATRLAALNRCREILQASGRGDQDPRCALYLWAQETGWGMFCQNNSWGNIKATRHFWSSDELILSDRPRGYTGIRECTSVHCLVDNHLSFDLYSDFPSPEQYSVYENRVLSQHYGSCIAGYVQGGLDGLLLATRERHLHGYSGDRTSQTQLDAKLRDATGYWHACERMVGARWVR